jgi:hypothetical protein
MYGWIPRGRDFALVLQRIRAHVTRRTAYMVRCMRETRIEKQTCLNIVKFTDD